jgi:hypothetical protein
MDAEDAWDGLFFFLFSRYGPQETRYPCLLRILALFLSSFVFIISSGAGGFSHGIHDVSDLVPLLVVHGYRNNLNLGVCLTLVTDSSSFLESSSFCWS